MRNAFENAYTQLRGSTHDRIIVNTSYSAESAEGNELAESLRSVCEKQYGDDADCSVNQICHFRFLPL